MSNKDTEGADQRSPGRTAIQTHPKESEDRVCLFHRAVAECIPSENGHLVEVLATRAVGEMEIGIQKHCWVLPGTYCEAHNKSVPLNSMEPRTHETIALGPTGNLQRSIKFYCLNTGQVLKHHLFTPMPMPDCIIKWVNTIRQCEGQGSEFRFLNQQCEPFTWTKEVPEDNPEFQGLLENEDEEAVYPDILAELPGVTLEDEEDSTHVLIEEEEPNFQDLATQALENAGIDTEERIWAGNNLPPATLLQDGSALVETNNDEIVYELTFDLPDAGLGIIEPNIPPAELTLGDDRNNAVVAPVAAADNKPE
jgi:hypothetical protein